MWPNRPTLGSLSSWRMWSTFKGSWPISASCVGVTKCVDTNSGYSDVFGFGLIYHIAQSWRLLSHTHAAVFGVWNRVPPAMVLETGRVSQQAPQHLTARWAHVGDTLLTRPNTTRHNTTQHPNNRLTATIMRSHNTKTGSSRKQPKNQKKSAQHNPNTNPTRDLTQKQTQQQ